MELIEFLFGILLTIIGVIFAEYFINYFKEKSDNHRAIKSIGYEICQNLAIFKINIEKLQKRALEGYSPFITIAYDNFKQKISNKLIKKLGNETIEFLFVGYIFCINFNNNLHLSSRKDIHSARNYLLECLNNIKENFDKFQESEKKGSV